MNGVVFLLGANIDSIIITHLKILAITNVILYVKRCPQNLNYLINFMPPEEFAYLRKNCI